MRFVGANGLDARHQRLIGPQELDSRQRQLLSEVCRGYNSPEIAARHGLARSFVRRYLSHTYQRIGVRDRAQAIGWCVAQGLISPEELQQVYLATGEGTTALPGGSAPAAHTRSARAAGKRGGGGAGRQTRAGGE